MNSDRHLRVTSGAVFRGEPGVSFGFNFNNPEIDNSDKKCHLLDKYEY